MISFISFFHFPSGITGLHDNLFSLSRFVHSSPCCTAVAMGFSSLSAQSLVFCHCPTGFYGLHSSVISWCPDCSPAFVEVLWNPPHAGSHLCGVKRAHHPPALEQAVLCEPQNCLGWFYCNIPLQTDAHFSACSFASRSFMFCLILLLCRYLVAISCLHSGLLFPRNARL